MIVSRAGVQCFPAERWEKKHVNSVGRDYRQLSFDNDSVYEEPLWGLKFVFTFLVEQPNQLKYLEWPSFQSTLKTATLTLVLIPLLIVALSSSLSVMDDASYDGNVFINTQSDYNQV
ncbi:hypothetical protein EZV62_018811 [Acer yangbiense]|uniref:Uncharacterized protein n=1 Tax=Acer yangbiense TaxID=1000413 RepID=A0A5C7HAK8_9ROSI|nr:hypothetical protein EZV62_018811 [Acer yangbiense]